MVYSIMILFLINIVMLVILIAVVAYGRRLSKTIMKN